MAFPFAKSNCYLHSTRTPLVVRWPGNGVRGKVDEDHYVARPTIYGAPSVRRLGLIALVDESGAARARPAPE
jgi:arylsulfatase A-like enzyme